MASSVRGRRKSDVPRVPGYTCPLETCSLVPRPLTRTVAVAAARRCATGVLASVCALLLGSGCGTPASGERPGHRTSLRTDDLPAPRRMTPDGPRVVLAPAHAEPDLVDERPPAPPAAAAAPAPGAHRVAAGETLYRIARGVGITPGALAEMNGISVSTPLAVGQVLIVPAPAGKAAAPAPPPSVRPEEARGEPEGGDSHGLPPALAAAFEAAGKPAGALRPSGASGGGSRVAASE